MALKTILTEPNKLLRQISQPVESVGDSERELMNDMLETMYDANGIGLAAIQIGVTKKNDEKKTYEEGCLSVPNQFAEIQRSSKCEIEYLDFNGNKQNLEAEGLLATYIQHEMDHLEGILFIDYLSKLKKEMIIKKLSKQQSKPDRIIV